jgi:peptidyl-prolyl cis-trans isomerase C
LAAGGAPLFDDPVVVKSKHFQIKDSDVQEAYVSHKATSAALGQPAAPQLEDRLKKQIVDKLVATKLFLARATPGDKDEGKKLADKMIAEGRAKAGSDASYRRRLLAVGSSPEKHEAEILEQAIVQTVIDRELKNKIIVSDAEVKKFYDANASAYTEPEKARVSHILFATRRIPTGEPLPLEERQAKKAAADRALAQLRAGADFNALQTSLNEDPEAKKGNAELTFTRGAGKVPPQFESAAFSLEPGKVSDVVTTVFGYHIVKLIERTPAAPVPLDKVASSIRERLQRQQVQAQLPDYIAKLRQEAGVEVTLEP